MAGKTSLSAFLVIAGREVAHYGVSVSPTGDTVAVDAEHDPLFGIGAPFLLCERRRGKLTVRYAVATGKVFAMSLRGINRVLAWRFAGDDHKRTVPDDVPLAELLVWETGLRQDPDTAGPFSDWCLEHQWADRADELRAAPSSTR